MPTQAELQILKERVKAQIPGWMALFMKDEGNTEDYTLDGDIKISFVLMLQCGGVIVVASIPNDAEGVYLFFDHLDDFPAGVLEETLVTSGQIRGSHAALLVTGLKDTDGEPVDLEGWKMAKVPVTTQHGTHVGAFRMSSCDNAFVALKHVVFKSYFPVPSADPPSSGAAAAPV
jgi:hypothetical protein